jgi:hypothetical protein
MRYLKTLRSRSAAGVVVIAIAGAVTALASGAESTATHPHEPSPVPPAAAKPAAELPAVNDGELDEIGRAVAKQWGESAPTDISRVAGLSRATAIGKLTGATVENAGTAVVDVVQEHGDFVSPTAPPGKPAPSGHTLTIVVSREGGRVMDLSLAEEGTPGQDLSQLGAGSPTSLP